MTNKSKQDCHADGWADIAPVDMSGEAHTDVLVQRAEIPGGPTEVTLNPGATAFAGVLGERENKSDPNAVVATGFSGSVPDVDGTVNADIVGRAPGVSRGEAHRCARRRQASRNLPKRATRSSCLEPA